MVCADEAATRRRPECSTMRNSWPGHAFVDAEVGGEDVAGIFYTGGTTGRSEGRDAEPPQSDGQRAQHVR